MKMLNQLQLQGAWAILSITPTLFANTTLEAYLERSEWYHNVYSLPESIPFAERMELLHMQRFTFTLLCLAAEGEEVADIVAREE